MSQEQINIQATNRHIEEMNRCLVGYWGSNIWDVRLCPVLKKPWTRNQVYLRFDYISNENIQREIKFYMYKRLTDYTASPASMWRFNVVKTFYQFLSNYYPYVNSVIDISKEKSLKEYQAFLIKKGKSIKTLGFENNSEFINFFLKLYDFIYNFYDEREEVEKDVWDVRNLNLDYNQATTNVKISFIDIPSNFKQMVKQYMKERLILHQSMGWGTARNYISSLRIFFGFISKKKPKWTELKNLNREDILNYIEFLRTTSSIVSSNHSMGSIIRHLENFIYHLQRFEWAEAPRKPVNSLIFSEDKPKHPKSDSAKIKYIPDYVWEQVIDNINKLSAEYIPILIVMEASGFRVSDVLSLKIDCLLKQKDGWWLVGDQRKVKYKSHKVPISEEVAKTIIAQQKLIKPLSTDKTNPSNYLFPRLTGIRVGRPISSQIFSKNLNRLARLCDIKDENGALYHFNNHAFRHRYGVNLINNGMKLLHVQKLMAHVSPEMTLVYAQIHDNTLRKEWEKARETGAIKIDVEGDIVPADLKQQAEENGLELEWIRHNMDSIRLDHGFCVKSPKLHCDFLTQSLEPPCIKNNCRSFHVDQTFLSYYEEQITKMESDIKVYEDVGRTRSIELIQPKLKRYKEIADGLKKGNDIHGLDKERREYIGEERERRK